MKNQHKVERFFHRINQDEDLLIEEILIGLIEEELIEENEWEIELQGGEKRAFRKDANRYDINTEKILFEVTRDGFFEKLPETLFLKSYYEKIPPSKREPEKERESAKSFFQILENQYYHSKLNFHKKKRNLLTGNLDRLFTYWGFPDYLLKEQKIRLLTAIPIIKYYKKSLENLSMLLGFILNLPVKLEYQKNSTTNFPSGFTSSLGCNSTLGRDFIIGERFNDCIPKNHIIIGKVNKKTSVFLHSNQFERQLKSICEYLLPTECAMSYEVLLMEEEKDFAVNGVDELLGQTTYI